MDEKAEIRLGRLMFGSINKKLLFSFIAAIIIVAFLTYFYIVLSQQSLVDALGTKEVFLASILMSNIEKGGSDKVSELSIFLRRSDIIGAVEKSNAEFDSMDDPMAYILSADRNWTYSPPGQDPPIVSAVINNAVAEDLRSEISLSEDMEGFPVYGEAFITNKYGAVVAETSKTTDYYQADEAWWQNARKEGLYVSDIIYDPSSDTYGLELCISFNDRNGDFAGVMKAVLSIRFITAIIDEFKKNAFYKDNEALDIELATSDGKLVYSTTPHIPYEDISKRDYMDRVFLSQQQYFITYYDDMKKQNLYLFAHVHSDSQAHFPSLGWSVTIYQPTIDAFKPIAELTRKIQILFVAVVMFIFVISIITSLSIVNPIRKLKNAAESIETGKFSQKVMIRSGDELQDLANAFNKSMEALTRIDDQQKQIDRAKTQFITITSHELRSPMTPMKANLQMLKEGYFGKLNKKQKEALDIVFRNTDRLDKILVDFLEISRIEAARLQFLFRETDLKNVTEETVKYMKGFMPEKKVRIELSVGKLPVVECDPDRVSQVLRNLVGNAIKFSPERGKVTVSVKSAKDHILFGIGDEGVGLSPENKERLFEPFFQVDKSFSRKIGGTGLGLAISKGIIESQNGKIWVESELGKGSTFFFTVPVEPVREIKPIRVLFSSRELVEKQIEDLFSEMLGPIGILEFEKLRDEGKLSSERLLAYADQLVLQGIIDREKAAKFGEMLSDVWARGGISKVEGAEGHEGEEAAMKESEEKGGPADDEAASDEDYEEKSGDKDRP